MTPAYLPLGEAAQYCGISVRTLERWIGAGLPIIQVSPQSKRLVRLADLDEWLSAKRQLRQSIDLDAMVEEVLVDLTQRH